MTNILYRFPQTLESTIKYTYNRRFSLNSQNKNRNIQVTVSDEKQNSYDLASIATHKGITLDKASILTKTSDYTSWDNCIDQRFLGYSAGRVHKGHTILLSDMNTYLIMPSNINTKQVNAQIGNMNLGNIEGSAEELAIYQDKCFVTLENNNSNKTDRSKSFADAKMLVYEGCDFGTNPKRIDAPFDNEEFRYNKAIEAFDISPEGKFLAIAEYPVKTEEDITKHKAWLWNYKKDSQINNPFLDQCDSSLEYDINQEYTFSYISDPDFGVSGIAFLPTGDLLVLERWYEKKPVFGYDGVYENYEIKVKIVYKKDIQLNAEVKGKTLIHIDNEAGSKKYVENYEAIFVKCDTDNSCEVFLVADDNGSPSQNTALLKFSMEYSHENEQYLVAHQQPLDDHMSFM